MDVAEVGVLVTSLATFTTSLGLLVTALRVNRKVDDVHKQVTPKNGKTLAETIEAVIPKEEP